MIRRLACLVVLLFLVFPAAAESPGGQGGGSGGEPEDGHGFNLTDTPQNYTQAAYQNLFTAGGLADDDSARIISHSGQSMLIEGIYNPGIFLDSNYSQTEF